MLGDCIARVCNCKKKEEERSLQLYTGRCARVFVQRKREKLLRLVKRQERAMEGKASMLVAEHAYMLGSGWAGALIK